MNRVRNDMLDRLKDHKLTVLEDTPNLVYMQLSLEKKDDEAFLYTFHRRPWARITVQSAFFTQVLSSFRDYELHWFLEHDDGDYVLSKFLKPEWSVANAAAFYKDRADAALHEYNRLCRERLDTETCMECGGEGRIEDYRGHFRDCTPCTGSGVVTEEYTDVKFGKTSSLERCVAETKDLLAKVHSGDEFDAHDDEYLAKYRVSALLHAADSARWCQSQDAVHHFLSLLFEGEQKFRVPLAYPEPVSGWFFAGQRAFQRQYKAQGLNIMRTLVSTEKLKERPAETRGTLLQQPYFQALMPVGRGPLG